MSPSPTDALAENGPFSDHFAQSLKLLKLGRTAAARDALVRALACPPPANTQVLIDLGAHAVQFDFEDVAEQVFETALQRPLSTAQVAQILDVAVFLRSPAIAEGMYQRILKRRHGDGSVYVLLGQFKMIHGDKAGAYASFSSAVSAEKLSPGAARRILAHITHASIAAGRVDGADEALLSPLAQRMGVDLHPQAFSHLRRVVEKARVFHAAAAAIDPGPLGLAQALVLAEQRSGSFAEALDRLGTGTGAVPAEIQALRTEVAALGSDARTDLDIWLACRKLVRDFPGVEIPPAKDGRAALLAGLAYSLRSRHRDALACLGYALHSGIDHWLPLWRAALAASALGLTDVAMCLARECRLRCPDFIFADNVWKHSLGYYAQGEQDFVIEAFFELRPPKGRFFVEVGAFDPKLLSNSRRLVDHGWQGIMVEPSPRAAARLRADARMGSVVVEAAAGRAEGTFELFEAEWPGLESGGGISSMSESQAGAGAQTFTTSAIQNPFAGPRQSGTKIMLDRMAPQRVRSRPLDDILAEYGAERPIDLLSLDVEGGEPEVFAGFSLETHPPQLIVVETVNQEMELRLRAAGYSLILMGTGDCYYALR